MISKWRRIPFIRWSFLRLMFGIKNLNKEWQVGDGREARLADYVIAHAESGNPVDVIKKIDEYAYNESFLINVGDEKGVILDSAIARINPQCILELGTYCGYSALRMAIAAPSAEIVSIEFNATNAEIARRILEHAGIGERIKIVVGTLGDGGKTITSLNNEYNFAASKVDLAFIDHAKEVYLSDLQLILQQQWLRSGALVVADNIKFPGAPEYHAYMKENEGIHWRTTEHETYVEYQSVIKDLVLVSEYMG